MSDDDFNDDILDQLIAEGVAGGFDPLDRNDPATAIGAHAIEWRSLSPEDVEREWRELREWVEWFVVRYRLEATLVPDCWWQHGRLVEELSALHTARLAAFDPTDAGFGPIGWHERFMLALDRIRKASPADCARGHHDSTPRTISTDEDAWSAWIKSSHGNSA